MENKEENIRFLKKSDLLEVAKKINATKDWQLSDYAWNEPQKKMIKKFLKKMLEKWSEVLDDNFPEEVVKLAGGSFYIGKEKSNV